MYNIETGCFLLLDVSVVFFKYISIFVRMKKGTVRWRVNYSRVMTLRPTSNFRNIKETEKFIKNKICNKSDPYSTMGWIP